MEFALPANSGVGVEGVAVAELAFCLPLLLLLLLLLLFLLLLLPFLETVVRCTNA